MSDFSTTPFQLDDLHNVYQVKYDAKYTSGRATEDQVLREFLKTFENEKSVDGVVSNLVCSRLLKSLNLIKRLQFCVSL